MASPKVLGGRRAGRIGAVPFYAQTRPRQSPAETVRTLMRDYQGPAGSVASVAAGGGSRGSTTSQGQSTAAETSVLTLTVPNGGTVTQDFGVIAQVGAIYGSYQAYRDVSGTDVVEAGSFKLIHDGATGAGSHTAEVAQPDPGTAFLGLDFAGSIAAGQLRLTLSDLTGSGNNITVELFYTRRAPLF